MTPPSDDWGAGSSKPDPWVTGASGSSVGSPAATLTDAGSASGHVPIIWVVAGLIAAAAGLAIALLLGGNIVLAVIAWAAAGPIAVGLFALFTLVDTKERAKPVYGERREITWLYRFGLLLALVGIIVAAYRIADWAGHNWTLS